MKINAAGVQRIKGTSGKGNEFDMSNLLTLVAIEPVNNAKVNISGHGYKVLEMALDPACLNQFAGIKFPAVLDVELEPRPRMGKYETTVVGIIAAK